MLPDPLVFVDVDTQRDFLEPSGSMYIRGSDAIVPNLNRLTAFARARGIPILATACAHARDDPDPEPFPPHCLIGTAGQERITATTWPGGSVLARDASYGGDIPPHLTIHKRHYDVFTHAEADRIVARYNRDKPLFVVYGVATDYCVRAVVWGLLDRGCRAALVVDAVRARDPEAEPAILTELAFGGALLALTDVVCDRS